MMDLMQEISYRHRFCGSVVFTTYSMYKFKTRLMLFESISWLQNYHLCKSWRLSSSIITVSYQVTTKQNWSRFVFDQPILMTLVICPWRCRNGITAPCACFVCLRSWILGSSIIHVFYTSRRRLNRMVLTSRVSCLSLVATITDSGRHGSFSKGIWDSCLFHVRSEILVLYTNMSVSLAGLEDRFDIKFGIIVRSGADLAYLKLGESGFLVEIWWW